jgi:hypothetical protein
MGRVVHFEIHVDDVERAKRFYGEVFGWTFQDWTAYVGAAYWGAVTGDETQPGINGALMQRQSAPPQDGQGVNAFVCTMGVDDYDATEAKILESGGKVSTPKTALTGMAWQGYYFDTEGNIFGIHQTDVNAK